jgi:RHS repeat-associated protein
VLKRGANAPDLPSLAALSAVKEAETSWAIVVTLPEAAAEALRRHGSVKYIQKVVTGPVAHGVGTAGEREVSASVLRLVPGPKVAPPTWSSGTYAYDGAGNITQIGFGTGSDTNGDGKSSAYVYDGSSRLVTAAMENANGLVGETYTYDPFGNMTQRTRKINSGNTVTTPIGVTTGTNRLSSALYDAGGNVTSPDGTSVDTYVYDPMNMQVQHVTSSGKDDYVYTADDERIGAFHGDKWVWSIRDLQGHVLREYQSSDGRVTNWATWVWLEDYVYRDGQLLGGERPGEEGGRRHYHLDHLGSPRLITNDAGGAISLHDYAPYGTELTSITQDTGHGFDRAEPMNFTGHERDFLIGTATENTNYLDYMHARHYTQEMGRFMSVDPTLDIEKTIHEPQAWNRYAYVTNNPLKYADSDGKDKFLAWLLGEAYRDVSTWDALEGALSPGDMLSAINQGRREWAEDHRALTHGFSPVPTTKAEVAVQMVMMGPVGKFIGASFGKLGTVIENQVGRITGFTEHGVNQVIARAVTPALLKSVTSNPTVVLAQSGGVRLFLTDEGAVVLNKAGQVVTAYTRKEFDQKILDVLAAAAAAGK